jgi:Tol biopolymer transport system component
MTRGALSRSLALSLILDPSVQLRSGSRLGPYEILAPLGAGGMGEVYRARDTRLDRHVAVKVLPSHLSESAHLRERFEREARAISKLSHPHICTLHDVGRHDGIDYLVLELLEGETLAERLTRGPLSLNQVARYGAEIARALGLAHREGVVHRDLKPGNIMLTKAGAKVLDFGLARYATPVSLTSQLSALPTEHKPITEEGSILGTLQYMSPEQLEGREADSRTDIFALGAILYEMTTGRPPFQAKSKASLIASIMEHEPASIAAMQPMSPPALDRIVHVCLKKDREERWQSAHDVALQLEAITEAPEVQRPSRAKWIATAAAAMAGLLVGVFAARALWMRQGSNVGRPVHLSLLPPENAAVPLHIRQDTLLTVSPDGRNVAAVVTVGGQTHLWLRTIESDESRMLPGTEGGASPFWSPDSQMIGFHSRGGLRKIDLGGGPPQTICAISKTGAVADWGADGTILFVENAGARGVVKRVPAAGGKPVEVGALPPSPNPRARWRNPQFLPDGKHFLASARFGGTKTPVRGFYVRSLDGKLTKRLFEYAHSKVTFVSPDLLVFVREGALMAQRFDLRRLETVGDPMPVASPVHYFEPTGAALFDVSETVLAYQPTAAANQLVWVDRSGAVVGSVGGVDAFQAPSVSPDGRMVAVSTADSKTGFADIWIYDLSRGFRNRISPRVGFESFPVWSPDGSRIVYAADRAGPPHLHLVLLSDPEVEERLTEPDTIQTPTDWSADGKWIVFSKDSVTAGSDIWLLPLGGDRKPVPLIAGDADERDARFSPDSRWIAFTSDETGAAEIYLAALERPRLRVRVSIEGGNGPRWSADGTELYYINRRDELMSVPVRRGAQLDFGTPRVLARLEGSRAASSEIDEDYTLDHRTGRFLINRANTGPLAVPVKVIVNWQSRLP